MYGQIKLIDGIRSFSPTRDKWIAKPVEELPKKVTVTFEVGQTGLLDMKNPRAVVWARLLDLQRRNTEPVYIEIDPETSVITQLLIPISSRVMSITPQAEGDVYVAFFRSEARHYLNRENPDFQNMLDVLQAAKDDETAVLITATRHDYEIIDVRTLPEEPETAVPPPPSPPPPDPPVSPERAQELFDLMNSKSCDACNASCSSYPHCIPFKHADDGCYARAHEMCRLMMDISETPEKVWIYGSLRHVAPTLMVTMPSGPPEKYVIDPSLCTSPVTVAAWKALQDDTSADLKYSTWEPFWSEWHYYDESDWAAFGITDPTFAETNKYLEIKCEYLQLDCVDFGPPPYQCPIVKSCHFVTDRNTFSESEIEAMLQASSPNPAEIDAAFYVVVDGFAPEELGVTAADLTGAPNIKPTFSITPVIAQMTSDAVALDVEDPAHLKRRQRLTWTYKITFTGTDGFGFTDDVETVTLSASIQTVSANATIYLIKQPNPYEVDGETSWLSTDLRVFQIKTGELKFGASMVSDASAFIIDVITRLNNGDTNGQTFEDDISVNQQTSRLELSTTVDGIPVFNFAVAKVRYRSLVAPAEDVRVFFRLFPWATTSVSYNQTTEYRRHESAVKVVPLLGMNNNKTSSIPCFASPRIDSATASMTTQTDAPNVQTIPAQSSGAEVVRYYGCWLDINQTQQHFPFQFPATNINGPYTNRKSIQDHIRNEHQCLVAEIAFANAPIQNGSTPSSSDKLAQRNLSIVESANPGLLFSRRIPQTFEIRPTASKQDHDELMIDWGDVPVGSVATLYLPGIDTNDILSLATKRHRSHRMVRIDEDTLKFETGGISYLPIPVTHGTYPALLTVDLPEGIVKDQAFTIVVRQVTAEVQQIAMSHRIDMPRPSWRHIVGSFQLTIPVREKADILPRQQRLLSNLRWIERAIPVNDRWSSVFGKYVTQIAHRVDALGGDSSKVAPSASGQWQQAYRNCLILTIAAILLIVMLVVDIGALTGGLTAIIGIPVFALLIGTVYLWINKCRPRMCQLLRVLLIGAGIGTVILALLAVFGVSTPQLITTLIVSVGVTALTAVMSWIKGCFK
jgi:hypothetical protein